MATDHDTSAGSTVTGHQFNRASEGHNGDPTEEEQENKIQILNSEFKPFLRI